MSRLKLTKASLSDRRQRLAVFGRVLPAMKLKRQQILHELAMEQALCQGHLDREQKIGAEAARIPFAAGENPDVEPVVGALAVQRGTETHLGAELPTVVSVAWSEAAPGDDLPLWVDVAAALVRSRAETRLQRLNAQARVDAWGGAFAKASRRVNLLEKQLIPRAQADIRRIAVFLSDNERMGIARSKLAARQRRRP